MPSKLRCICSITDIEHIVYTYRKLYTYIYIYMYVYIYTCTKFQQEKVQYKQDKNSCRKILLLVLWWTNISNQKFHIYSVESNWHLIGWIPDHLRIDNTKLGVMSFYLVFIVILKIFYWLKNPRMISFTNTHTPSLNIYISVDNPRKIVKGLVFICSNPRWIRISGYQMYNYFQMKNISKFPSRAKSFFL